MRLLFGLLIPYTFIASGALCASPTNSDASSIIAKLRFQRQGEAIDMADEESSQDKAAKTTQPLESDGEEDIYDMGPLVTTLRSGSFSCSSSCSSGEVASEDIPRTFVKPVNRRLFDTPKYWKRPPNDSSVQDFLEQALMNIATR